MRLSRLSVLLFAVIVFLSGCALPPHYNVLEDGQAIPPGQALLIAKFQLDPFVDQGNLPIYMGKTALKRGEMYVMMFPERKTPYKKGSMMPLPMAGAISANVKFTDTSFIPMPPGDKFIRYGTLDQAVTGTFDGKNMTTTIHTLSLMGDVEIDIPQDAKAVYAGTITWHYEKGNITVKDEYKAAMHELDEAKIPGLTSQNVVKRLAKAFPPNLAK